MFAGDGVGAIDIGVVVDGFCKVGQTQFDNNVVVLHDGGADSESRNHLVGAPINFFVGRGLEFLVEELRLELIVGIESRHAEGSSSSDLPAGGEIPNGATGTVGYGEEAAIGTEGGSSSRAGSGVMGTATVSAGPPSLPTETPPASASRATIWPERSTGSRLKDWSTVPDVESRRTAAEWLKGPERIGRSARDGSDPLEAGVIGFRGLSVGECGGTRFVANRSPGRDRYPIATEDKTLGINEGKQALVEIGERTFEGRRIFRFLRSVAKRSVPATARK